MVLSKKKKTMYNPVKSLPKNSVVQWNLNYMGMFTIMTRTGNIIDFFLSIYQLCKKKDGIGHGIQKI